MGSIDWDYLYVICYFYLVHTLILTCEFDLLEGNEKIAYDFRINGEFAGYTADGMAIDRDGLLWIGLFKGNSIVAVDPE